MLKSHREIPVLQNSSEMIGFKKAEVDEMVCLLQLNFLHCNLEGWTKKKGRGDLIRTLRDWVLPPTPRATSWQSQLQNPAPYNPGFSSIYDLIYDCPLFFWHTHAFHFLGHISPVPSSVLCVLCSLDTSSPSFLLLTSNLSRLY